MRLLWQLLLLIAFIFITWTAISAQTQLTNTPNASPKAMVQQTIGLTEVSITYYRPAAKGRAIWEKLVPKNVVWRAGANDNTIFTFSTPVTIAGKTIEEGTYGFHLLPQNGNWVAIFSKNSTSWGSFSYNKGEDALRVDLTPIESTHFYEYLTYEFTNFEKGRATCTLNWGGKSIPIPIEVDLEQTVIPQLTKQLRNKAGWSWQGWHEAANYCLQNDLNSKQAFNWATRSVFMSPNTQNLVVKARLAAKIQAGDDEAKAQQIRIQSLETDLKTSPVSWKEWHGAANHALQTNATDKALEWVDKSISMSANMTNMMTKVSMLEAKGDNKAATKLKTKALQKGSNGELNNYGYRLLFAGKTAEAVEVFHANAQKHPNDPNVWDSLGEGYYNNGQKEEAISAFKKSLSLNPPANVKANSMKILKQMGVDVP